MTVFDIIAESVGERLDAAAVTSLHEDGHRSGFVGIGLG